MRGDILRGGNGRHDDLVDAETNVERLGDEALGAVALIDGHGLLVRSWKLASWVAEKSPCGPFAVVHCGAGGSCRGGRRVINGFRTVLT